MKPTFIPCVLLLLSIATAQAAQYTITGRVIGDDGQPIADAIIDSGDKRVASDAGGRFELRVATDVDGRLELRAAAHMPVSLRIAADGYYTTIHTFAQEDLEATTGDLGTIEIVARKPDRRLLLFTGDAMLARRYFEPRDGETRLVRRGKVLEDGQAVLTTIKPYVELADFASVNMETQLTDKKLTDS